MSYDSDQYFEYTPDGDKVDKRNRKIKDLQSEITRMKVHMNSQELAELAEKIIRDNNPTVKNAWEQYQIALRLVIHD